MDDRRITLDVSKAPAPIQVIRTGAGDSATPTVTATVTDGGEPVDLTGLSARFEMREPNGTVRTAQCSVSGSEATFQLPSGMAPGATEVAYLVVESEDAEVSTQRVRVEVLEGRTR